MNEIDRLLAVATQLRQAIQATPATERPPPMVNFPRDACGWSSLILGAAFVDLEIYEFIYISAERYSDERKRLISHAWLQSIDFVVDITADQFSDGPIALVFPTSSEWHSQFEVKARRTADFRPSIGPGTIPLLAYYNRLKIRSIMRQ